MTATLANSSKFIKLRKKYHEQFLLCPIKVKKQYINYWKHEWNE